MLYLCTEKLIEQKPEINFRNLDKRFAWYRIDTDFKSGIIKALGQSADKF